MVDILDKKSRSALMAKVRSKDTRPEILVRSALHSLGYRFRLHDKRLPGCPDIVLKKWGLVIFVHGCFWHQHQGCKKSKRPTSRKTFWNKKLDENVARDERKRAALESLGWRVEIIWECQIQKPGFEAFILKMVGGMTQTTKKS